jgi:hypothetical protein
LHGAEPAARTVRDADDLSLAPTERRATATDYVLGVAFALGGIALGTIDPVRTALKDGECADPACRNVYAFSSRSALEVAGGVALIATGAAISFWWKPFAVHVQTGERTSVALQTRF